MEVSFVKDTYDDSSKVNRRMVDDFYVDNLNFLNANMINAAHVYTGNGYA